MLQSQLMGRQQFANSSFHFKIFAMIVFHLYPILNNAYFFLL